MSSELRRTPVHINNFFSLLRHRLISLNKNVIIIITGQTGGGKSWGALTIADRVSPRGITVDDNVIMGSTIGFMEKLVNCDDLEKGDVLVMDEGGVNFGARDFASKSNKLIGSVLQTFRGMNVGVIFTVPNLDFIDKQGRNLCHYLLEAVRVDRVRNECIMRILEVQYNSRVGKTYYKAPKFEIGGEIITVQYLRVPKPRQDLVDRYEQVKDEFISNHNKSVLSELKGEDQDKRKDVNIDDEIKPMVEEILRNKDKFLKVWGGKKKLNANLIRHYFNIGDRRSRLIKDFIEHNCIL